MGGSHLSPWDYFVSSPAGSEAAYELDPKTRSFEVDGTSTSTKNCLSENAAFDVWLNLCQYFVVCIVVVVFVYVYLSHARRDELQDDDVRMRVDLCRYRAYHSGGLLLILTVVLQYQYGTHLKIDYTESNGAAQTTYLCVPRFSVLTDSVLSNLVMLVALFAYFSIYTLSNRLGHGRQRHRFDGAQKEIIFCAIQVPALILLAVAALNIQFEDRWTNEIWSPSHAYSAISVVSRTGARFNATLLDNSDMDDLGFWDFGVANRYFVFFLYWTIYYVLNRGVLESYVRVRNHWWQDLEDTVPDSSWPPVHVPWLREPYVTFRDDGWQIIKSIGFVLIYHGLLLMLPVGSAVVLTFSIAVDACLWRWNAGEQLPSPKEGDIKWSLCWHSWDNWIEWYANRCDHRERMAELVAVVNLCCCVVLLQFCVFFFCIAFPPYDTLDFFHVRDNGDMKYAFHQLLWITFALFILPHFALLCYDVRALCCLNANHARFPRAPPSDAPLEMQPLVDVSLDAKKLDRFEQTEQTHQADAAAALRSRDGNPALVTWAI